uniref:Uncharacterized protein n=1 Tax=Rhizophora mucronata TaxID=61149 RepID=A0A2P2PWK4_RHIMU
MYVILGIFMLFWELILYKLCTLICPIS